MHKERAGRTIDANNHWLSTPAFERGGVGGMYWEKGDDPASSPRRAESKPRKEVSLRVLCALRGKTVFCGDRRQGSYSLPVLSSPGTWPSSRVEVLFAAR